MFGWEILPWARHTSRPPTSRAPPDRPGARGSFVFRARHDARRHRRRL